MSFWSYSPEDVNIILAGIYNVEGLSEGKFVEITKDTMPIVTQRTTDGMVSRKRTTNTTYTINISLLGASGANKVFTRLYKVDELTNYGKFPILIKDSSGSGYFFSPTCWVESIPSLAFSTTMENNLWVLRAHGGIINIGGNEPSSDIGLLTDVALSSLPYIQQILEKIE